MWAEEMEMDQTSRMVAMEAANPPSNRSAGAGATGGDTTLVVDGKTYTAAGGAGGFPPPRRVQRSRRTPLPPNTVYVGRPTMWGNPVQIKDAGSHGQAVEWYRLWFLKATANRHVNHVVTMLRESLPTLTGKNLACWCPLNRPCHADVLLRAANPELGPEDLL